MQDHSLETRVRVLIVEDSRVAREVLHRVLGHDDDIEVVGEARTGREAVELTRRLQPQVILMDVVMPEMDGLEATEYIMAHHPTPILVVTSAISPNDREMVCQAIALGAIDVLPKPSPVVAGRGLEPEHETLLWKIKVCAGAKVIRHVRGLRRSKPGERPGRMGAEAGFRQEPKIVTIAASTGGPAALRTVFSGLGDGLGVPILIVQHIARGFAHELAEWLSRETALSVVLSSHGSRVQPATAYIAADGCHTKVLRSGVLIHDDGPPVEGHRPSADVLFESVAREFGRHSVGLVLTGMGDDGARGLLQLRRAGAYTIVQDEKSSAIFGMPKVAHELGGAMEVLGIERMAGRLVQLCEGGTG